MSLAPTSRGVSSWLPLGILVLVVTLSAYGQQQPNQKESNGQQAATTTADEDAVLVASAESAPAAPVTSTAGAPAPPPPSGFNWTGFYVGVNAGHASGSAADTGVNPL